MMTVDLIYKSGGQHEAIGSSGSSCRCVCRHRLRADQRQGHGPGPYGAEDIGKIAKGKKPAPNSSSVELLKGGEYYRVWINRGGTNYIINMPVGS